MTTTNRITGMFSGLDTESLIKKMMDAERIKVDRVGAQKKITEWRRDQYRDISSVLNGLQSEYFDFLKPTKNLRSSATFNINTAAATLGGNATTAVTVKASTQITATAVNINSITQLATKDTYQSSSRIKDIVGTVDFVADPAATVAAVNAAVAGGNETFKVSMNGVTKSIALTGGYADENAMLADLQGKLTTAFGSKGIVPNIVASFSGGKLKLDAPGHEVVVTEQDPNILATLGLTSGATNTINSNATLASVFGVANGDMDLTINGVSNFGILATDTIAQMMSKINASSAGVSISYSSVSGKFSLTANSEGIANTIALTDTDGFFANKLKLDGAGYTAAKDAIFSVDGVETSRSSNTFSVGGIDITLNATHAAGTDIKIGVKRDATQLVETIKGFVAKYNEVIEQVNSRLDQKRNYDYVPLTDAQKKDMKEEDIKSWEDRAKAGLLRGDSTLQKIASDMRMALQDAVSGAGITLREVGITPSSNYKDNGKLQFDETTFKSAVESRPDQVIALFTAESDAKYSERDRRSERFSENGIITRVYDILQDNIRITRDSDGKKGVLLEKAGNFGDKNDFTSELSRKMLDYDLQMSEMLKKLYDKENRYYAQFARLESAMQRYSAQSEYVSKQFGG